MVSIIRKDTLFLVALLASTTLLLAHLGYLTGFDQYLYDAQTRLWKQPAPDDIVIIAIDEASLEELGSWPWSSTYHDRLLRQDSIAGARSVLFNFQYSPGSGNHLEPGERLVNNAHEKKYAAVPAGFSYQSVSDEVNRTTGTSQPLSVASTLSVDLVQDADGIVRSLYLMEGDSSPQWKSQNVVPASGTVIRSVDTEMQTGGWYSSAPFGDKLRMNDRIYIPYTGPSGNFHQIPYHKALSGDIPPDAFHDKHVIIGVTAAGLARRYPVPAGGYFEPMNEVEIIANTLNALNTATYIKPVDNVWYLAYSGMFALAPFLLFTFFSPRVNALVTLMLAAAAMCISLLLVAVFYRWLPPAVALVAVAMSYLMWSSRRLHNAVNYLGRELAHLNAEMAGREVDLTTRTESAFNFLERLLPVKGWYVADVDGNVKYSSGMKPRLAAVLPSRGTWINEGDQFWTCLVEDRHKLEVGLRWASASGPTPREMGFLNKFLGQFGTFPEQKEHESVEVVEKLIAQIQESLVSLQTMQRFFDDCLAQMADGLLVTNELGKVLFANNRAAIYLQGHSINNPAGKNIFRLLDNLDAGSAEACKKLLQEAYLEGTPASIDLGKREGLELLLNITPLMRGKTGFGGVIITLSDISYLKSIERARNETISFVSHDLRSPLVSILALLELAKSSDSLEETQKLHKRIGEYTHLTINMAEQFIQLARVESDAEIKLVDMDLVSVAVNAYEQVWFQAQSRKINLVREIKLDHAWVKGDAGLLERSITNLLNNAIKYSPEGRTVHMRLFSEDGNICCCIEDQGDGIPEDELPSLFDRFHSAHRNSGVDVQGIGLGLALVKVTAERHGGDIHVASKEGKGSRFCLLLPEISIED